MVSGLWIFMPSPLSHVSLKARLASDEFAPMSLFPRFFSRFRPATPLDPDDQAGLQRIAALVDKTLAVAPGFAARLAAPVAHARKFCAGLVDSLPPAVTIDRPSFSSDPLVHALFASADDIDSMLIASEPVRTYLAEPRSWQEDSFIALMAARRMDKKVLGVALQGEIVMTDVPQTLLQFANQTVILPADNPASARDAFLKAAFDSLLLTFAGHLARARETYRSLHAEREMERVRRRTQAGAIFPERCITALDERLQRQFQSLQPKEIIDELADFLMQPEQALSLDPMRLWVTRRGVIQEDACHDADAAAIHFMELKSRDRRRHLVLPVRVRCAEAMEALAHARETRAAREYMLLL
ncbi:MAG: hypothetical protein FWH56_12810 [Betaproteobacteria bacterium]|nr:hypothetical protein [Betaproteobacteria bacterium]